MLGLLGLLAALCGSLDGHAARVNDETINAQRFHDELVRRHGDLILQDMIDDRLLAQEARRLQLRVDEGAVSRRAQDQGNNELDRVIARREWLLEQLSRKQTVVAEGEIRDYYEAFKPSFANPRQLRLRSMVLNSRENAEQLHDLLRRGGNFAELTRTFSIDMASRARGGDLGWIPLNALNPGLREAVESLQPGQISRPIELSGEWHLLKLEGLKPERQKPLSEVRAEVRARVFNEKLPMTRHHLLADLRKRASIVVKP